MRTFPRVCGRWPFGLVGMLALIVVAERYLTRHAWKFTPIHASAWQRAVEGVPQAAQTSVVAFGDSLVKNGVIPSIVADRAGRPVSNLAIPGGVFPAHHALFRRLLGTGARPEAVLVDGELLGHDPFEVLRYWIELANTADNVGLARQARDPNFLARAAVAKILPSYKARGEVRDGLMAALDGKTPKNMVLMPMHWRNWRVNGGAEVSPNRDLSKGDSRPEELERDHYWPVYWPCHPLNDAYVTRFLDLAQAHGVPVFWLLPPYHPETQRRREGAGWWNQYEAYLRGLQTRYPRLTVVDGRRAGYPAEAIFDMTHLSRTGAVAFSHAVGGLLRDALDRGAPRWIDLPRYNAGQAEALANASGVEDTLQSNTLVKRLMAGNLPEVGDRIGLSPEAPLGGERSRR